MFKIEKPEKIMFAIIEIISKIKYNQEYDEIINNNFKISKENKKKLIKEFQILNIE